MMSNDTHTMIDLSLLPALPGVAREILTQFNDEFVAGKDVAATVEKDPGITARLVSLANSAYFGLPRPVTDMEEIVVRVLGVDNVRALALALATANVFKTTSMHFRLEEYWLRAFLAGEACRRAALQLEACSDEVRSLSYTAGFCSDIGWIALATVAPAETDHVFAMIADNEQAPTPEQSHLIIKEQLGLTPREATAELARKWGMPEPICAAYDTRGGADKNIPPLSLALKVADDAIRRVLTSDSVQISDPDDPSAALVESSIPTSAYQEKAATLVASLTSP